MKPAGSWEDGIYYAALKISDVAERDAFLDQACAGDAELRGDVEELLAAHDQSEEFFNRSSSALKFSAATLQATNGHTVVTGDERVKLPEEEKIGAHIGNYRLVGRIGEGGCGTVYQAEQEQPVRRQVALKIIKLGMDTKNVIARFGAERQALALMDHANIARALDAGTTDKGRPFFVMELVRGVKITNYCDEHNLDIPQRLDLFIQICHAIQHAHQKGIIHRDIKPSNILVSDEDGVAVPKVIDFGISKAVTGGRLANHTVFTACDQFVGTPAYMSPEQADMGRMDIDTRSDIYSLGVLLYELLASKTPFEANALIAAGMDEMRRTLREKEPPRPSAMLASLSVDELSAAATHRGIERDQLEPVVRGDLDWIVMKTLEKDRARRYETANALAQDIQRYLHSEPVEARPPSRLYQFQKLVRRNRAPFAAAAIVAATLCSALGTSTWLFFQERQARQDTEQEKAKEVLLLARELDLVSKTEARQNITMAAIAIGDGKYDDADTLVKKIPIAYYYPSLEAAAVFRTIGVWHALHGRWKDASYQFGGLLQVNLFENEKSDPATRDLLEAAAPLLEIGDLEGYDRFRVGALHRFGGTASPVIAERIIRAILLNPLDNSGSLTSLGRALEKPANVGTNASGSGPVSIEPEAAWVPVALALLEYRQFHFAAAASHAQTVVTANDTNPARLATSRIILAMARFRLGQRDDAIAQLSLARTAIDAIFSHEMKEGDDKQGNWFDWAMARILLREATHLIVE